MMKSMTEKVKESWDLMIDCLLEMKLPKENIRAIATMLQTEEQIETMLDWIRKHAKENPSKLRVMLVAKNIKDGVQ